MTRAAFANRSALYARTMVAAARAYGIDPRVLWAIARIETSSFSSFARSPRGAIGIMQFMPQTAQRYGLRDRRNPEASIYAAAHYIKDLSARFGGRLDLVLAGYNAGEGAVTAYLEGRARRVRQGRRVRVINPRGLRTGGIPPYGETRNYVVRGLRAFDEAELPGASVTVATAAFAAPPALALVAVPAMTDSRRLSDRNRSERGEISPSRAAGGVVRGGASSLDDASGTPAYVLSGGGAGSELRPATHSVYYGNKW